MRRSVGRVSIMYTGDEPRAVKVNMRTYSFRPNRALAVRADDAKALLSIDLFKKA